MSNTHNWHLTNIRPKLFTSCSALVDDSGEPYDGLILSMPGSEDVMKHIAQSQVPTVLVNITDQRLSARYNAVASVWNDNADIGCSILSDGVEVTLGGQTIVSNGVTGGTPTFTVPANGHYTIGGMGSYTDFSFGPQTITLTSGGGSPTDKRANFSAPTIKITSLQTYPYTSGQKLYYY